MDKMMTMKGKMDQLKGIVGGKIIEVGFNILSLSHIHELILQMGDSMEKSIRVIESREKSLSLQMESSLGKLKEKKDDLAEKSETYK